MENKRLILAIALSVGLILGWQAFSKYMGWLPEVTAPPVQEQAQSAAPASSAAPQAAVGGEFDEPAAQAAAPVPAFTPGPGRLVSVETPLYKAVLHSNGGILRRFDLKNYRTTVDDNSPLVELVSDMAAAQAPLGVMINGKATWVDSTWDLDGDGSDVKLEEGASQTLRFVGVSQGMRVVRELTFSGSAYTVSEKIHLEPLGDAQNVNLAFTFAATTLASDKQPGIIARLRHLFFGGEPPAPEESQYNTTRVAWLQNNSFDEEMSTSSLAEGHSVKAQLHWMGVMNNYFLGAVSMNDPAAEGRGRFSEGVYHARLGKTGVLVPKEGTDLECIYFLGPKETTIMEEAPNGLGKALDYGMFSVIARPLVWLLQFLYGFAHNYGIAIILMTIIIKALFWPLSQKSYRSMQQMKELQPLMTKLREKHAGDKEALNREVMQLYKTYKVNPAGGCLPILVQLPVLFGLYQALLNAIELRHAPFIEKLPFTDLPWLNDLAAPDPYWVTPLVMGATMLLMQKLSPAPADPTQAKIMMFMPVMFTLISLNFPSGLVVYWLVINLISIGQQWLQQKQSRVNKAGASK